MTFTLEKADSKEFARWWVVYRNANEDFSQSFTEQYKEIADVPFCHWIMADGRRIGGIITVSKNVGDFFLIPPFTDAYSALKAILTNEISNARSILPEHVPAFQSLGFVVKESRRWMLRPIQTYDDVSFDFLRSSPQAKQTDTIAELMYRAFHGGVGQYGQREVDAHRHSVEDYFNTIKTGDSCHQASSVLYDGDKMIAACLVQPYNTFATVRFVITHPDYQRRGLAKHLIQHASNTLKDDYEYLGLAVTMGNPAQSLYYDMGFLPGVVTYTLARS